MHINGPGREPLSPGKAGRPTPLQINPNNEGIIIMVIWIAGAARARTIAAILTRWRRGRVASSITSWCTGRRPTGVSLFQERIFLFFHRPVFCADSLIKAWYEVGKSEPFLFIQSFYFSWVGHRTPCFLDTIWQFLGVFYLLFVRKLSTLIRWFHSICYSCLSQAFSLPFFSCQSSTVSLVFLPLVVYLIFYCFSCSMFIFHCFFY